MALLIRRWEHRCKGCLTQAYYTVKVLDKGRVFRAYPSVDQTTYDMLLKQYNNHSIIDFVNVLNKTELRK
jgi:transposase-like protein